jgi:hypothetical protein
VHSIVRLTEEGRIYFGAQKREVILTEVFTDHKDVLWWKYEFRSVSYTTYKPINKSTTRSPNELIEEVVMEASADYTERQIFGTDSPLHTMGKKIVKKDWEIPEVMTGWIVFILVIIGVVIFKDWYVQLLLRGIAGYVFAKYRKAHIDARTTYEYNEDTEIEAKKYEILYK